MLFYLSRSLLKRWKVGYGGQTHYRLLNPPLKCSEKIYQLQCILSNLQTSKILIWMRKCELPGLLFVPQTSVCSDFSSETSWVIPLLCCTEPTPPCGLSCIFCIETKRESEGVKMIKFNRNTLCILAFFAFRHLRMSSLEDNTLKRFFLDIYLPFRL